MNDETQFSTCHDVVLYHKQQIDTATDVENKNSLFKEWISLNAREYMLETCLKCFNISKGCERLNNFFILTLTFL